MAYAEKRGAARGRGGSGTSSPGQRRQRIRVRDPGFRARVGPGPGIQDEGGPPARAEPREDHGQRVDREVAGHAGRRPQHRGHPRVPDPQIHPPGLGRHELGSLSSEEITAWENAIPARTGVSRRVARDARSLLATILGDAAAATPPLIPANPAIRPPNRGRRTGRGLSAARRRCGPRRCRPSWPPSALPC